LVATSRGFRAAWDETTCSLEQWIDETADARYARRALPADAEIDALAAGTARLAQELRSASALPAIARGALFAPQVVEELVARLLLPNLAGRAIRDGRSPFTRTDIDGRRMVLRPDVDLVVDTTLPFELASAPCSPEGVPAGRVALIAGGRLASPLLDLASAAAFGRHPTPVARGRPLAVVTSSTRLISWPEALALLGAGVVVRDLPGLHTQSPRRGSYALVVPDAQVVSAGAPGGRCAVRLMGNLLDHLRHPDTHLVAVPGHRTPGLLVTGNLSMTPA
jgi:predicted Zn-dependent protease